MPGLELTGPSLDLPPEVALSTQSPFQWSIGIPADKAQQITPGQADIHGGKIQTANILDDPAPGQSGLYQGTM